MNVLTILSYTFKFFWKQELMKISIITVCFNSENTIEDTLKSIQSQTYQNIEYIVIDGGSSDSTNEIISRYDSIVSLHISEKDRGLYDAMNKGIKLATGDVVGILNSDDVFHNDTVVEKIVLGFEVDDMIDAVYSDIVYTSHRCLDEIVRLYSSKFFTNKRIKYGLMLPHPSFYVKKTIFDKLGYYKLNYRVAADFELLARFLVNNVVSKRLNIISVRMRQGGVSSNGFLWRIHQNFEIVRACKENKIYTNILLVSLKIPIKLFSYVTGYNLRRK